MSKTEKKLLELKSLIEGAEISLQQSRKIIANLTGDESALVTDQAKKTGSITVDEEGQVIEGVFDGQNMVGPDEKKYSVPANYASKSKLVEGDTLKLTIMPDGSFVYKQINLLDRDRIVGKLTLDEETGDYRVLANNKSYKVLSASVTYYKGEEGDSVTILVPKDKESSWAAIENIFKPGEEIEAQLDNQETQAEPKKEDVNHLGGITTAESVLDGKDRLEAPAAEQTKDEFLSQEPVADKKKPEDIFEAAEKVDTQDVKQVDMVPPAETQTADNLGEKDSQGLEPL